MTPDQPALATYAETTADSTAWNSIWDHWNSTYQSFVVRNVYDAFLDKYLTAEEAAAAANARACRCRDLGGLYRDELPKRIQIRKPVLCRFQPVWSARRWRSVT